MGDDGQPLPAMEIGEIGFRTAQFPTEYLNNPEATARHFRGGWFYPGDFAAINEDGYIFLMGRTDDAISHVGENFYPIETERVLLSHEAVVEAAVFGLMHPSFGEVPVAAVVANEFVATDALQKLCEENLDGHKQPFWIQLLPELPKNLGGKVIKSKLEEIVTPPWQESRTVKAGWMYRAPKDYDGVIGPRFDQIRERAFDYLFQTGLTNLGAHATCLELACGTGITTVSLAKRKSDLVVIGIDASKDMLAEATQKAEREGLASRCRFKQSDVHALTPDTLTEMMDDGRSKVEMIACALGFSVIPNWEAAFNQTLELLEDDGVYVIFDQYEPGLYLPEFDANTSRESWKLLEQNFINVDVKWFGNMFIAIGQKKKVDQSPGRPITEQTRGADAESLYQRGKLLAEQGDHRGAARSFSSCLALEPKTYKAWARLGKSLAIQQELPGAADAYRKALILRPESYTAHRKLSEVLSRMGQVEDGWRYKFPEAYDLANVPWIGEVRQSAFDFLFDTGVVDFVPPVMCLDLACGTGITTMSLAESRPELFVIGIDASPQMLAEARRKAEQEGLSGRCSFRESDVLNVTPSALPELEKHGREDVDMITCALGYSVFPHWEEAFYRTNQLLHDDGVYVIFDQYLAGDTGLAHPGMGANQSRESWKILEQHFVHMDVKWFGNVFIAIGHKKRT